MIVSIDTIKCGRQIVLFFQQETVVVVETCEILLIFLKKGLLLLKKHFETIIRVRVRVTARSKG